MTGIKRDIVAGLIGSAITGVLMYGTSVALATVDQAVSMTHTHTELQEYIDLRLRVTEKVIVDTIVTLKTDK